MSDKEKLVELLDDIQARGEDFTDYEIYGMRVPDTVSNEDVASYLIANGVTVQELDGCEYCKEDSEGFRRMFGAFSLVNPFHGKTWQIHAGKCKPREIYFCPMCGRRLLQPPKGE